MCRFFYLCLISLIIWHRKKEMSSSIYCFFVAISLPMQIFLDLITEILRNSFCLSSLLGFFFLCLLPRQPIWDLYILKLVIKIDFWMIGSMFVHAELFNIGFNILLVGWNLWFTVATEMFLCSHYSTCVLTDGQTSECFVLSVAVKSKIKTKHARIYGNNNKDGYIPNAYRNADIARCPSVHG